MGERKRVRVARRRLSSGFAGAPLIERPCRDTTPQPIEQMRGREHFAVGQLLLEQVEVSFEFFARYEAAVDQLVANVVDEVTEDRTAAVPNRIDMDDGVDVDIRH